MRKKKRKNDMSRGSSLQIRYIRHTLKRFASFQWMELPTKGKHEKPGSVFLSTIGFYFPEKKEKISSRNSSHFEYEFM